MTATTCVPLVAREDLERPSGLAVDPSGTRVYVVDTGGVDSENHRVVVFDDQGIKLNTIGSRGTEPGEFNLPLSATVTPDGIVHVVDGGNFRIQSFSPEGEWLASFGQVGRTLGTFSRPKSIAHDADGRLYVSDAAFGNFQIFDQQGHLLLFIGERAPQGGPAQYMLTSGIAVDEEGRIFVVDQFFRKVDVFRPASVPAGSLGGLGQTTQQPPS